MHDACSAMISRGAGAPQDHPLRAALQRLDEASRSEASSILDFMAGIGDEISTRLVDALDLGEVAEQRQDAAAALAAAS